MTDDLRWAVRYAFAEDLWRNRARVIVDAGLEATLREGSSRPADDESPLGELADALVPRASKARTWVAVADEAVARELAQARPGTGFLPRASFAEVVAHRDWEVALVELAALSDDVPGGTQLRAELAQRAKQGRTVIIGARALYDEDDEDITFEALSDLLEEQLGGGRIFGVYRPPMAGVVDFGGGEEEGESEDEEVPLSFDNTLGSQAPRFVEYVAVAGQAPPLPEGLTLVELPADAGSIVASSDDALRGQLVQAQRQAELAAIDRQALLEKVDDLESEQAQLERQATELRDRLARAVNEAPPEASEAHERLQAALADNQALRWKVQQIERELRDSRARPVDELEAEVAQLRARLAAAQTEEPAVEDEAAQDEAVEEGEAAEAGEEPEAVDEADTDEADADETTEDEAAESGESDDDRPSHTVSGVIEVEPAEAEAEADDEDDDDEDFEDDEGPEPLIVVVAEADEQAERMRRGKALRQLDRLIERVERGGIGALQLRSELVQLRQRLRS
ncbi:MAG: hypothetical protein AAF799_47365 [Myxococcota bacterium]